MSLQAQELRIGNWVIFKYSELSKEEILQIKGIDYNGKYLFYDYYSQDG